MSRFSRCGAALAVTALLTAGCSTTEPEPAPVVGARASTPAPTPVAARPPAPGPSSPAGKRAVRATVDAVRHYLDTWVTDGPARAARSLYPRTRVTSDQGLPRLLSGSLESFEVSRWRGPDAFTLQVTLDLRFDGSPYAWQRGLNERFVTPHRQGEAGPYLLELASSP